MMGLGYGREWIPFEFWEYTTVVLGRLFECEPAWDDSGKALRSEMRAFEEDLLARFREAGIRCALDNKIAFGLKHEKTGQLVYIGFKDGQMSIGTSVRADEWLRPIRAEVCGVEYHGPSAPEKHGTKCALPKGHDAGPPDERARHWDANRTMGWYTPEQKERK